MHMASGSVLRVPCAADGWVAHWSRADCAINDLCARRSGPLRRSRRNIHFAKAGSARQSARQEVREHAREFLAWIAEAEEEEEEEEGEEED